VTSTRDDVPPTYDLRELGEGMAIYERLDRLPDCLRRQGSACKRQGTLLPAAPA
jgi:hypothetical protein